MSWKWCVTRKTQVIFGFFALLTFMSLFDLSESPSKSNQIEQLGKTYFNSIQLYTIFIKSSQRKCHITSRFLDIIESEFQTEMCETDVLITTWKHFERIWNFRLNLGSNFIKCTVTLMKNWTKDSCPKLIILASFRTIPRHLDSVWKIKATMQSSKALPI